MTPQINRINTTKNLLAFSGGVDSSALFYILLENNIPFDIAIVNYNLRKQSTEEVLYAKELALKYNKKIYVKEVALENTSNFEKKARDIRYAFFEEIIDKNSYETLITAHQLNDKFEWFLMQLSKGAGLVEILSFEEITFKKTYTICKPLINISREILEEYLKKNDIEHFIDETNFDEKYKRNYFRKNFSNDFIKDYAQGLERSFEYLQKDLNSLNTNEETILKIKELEIFNINKDDNINIRIIDKNLKQRGFLLSKLQREEILKQKECVISHKIAISLTKKYIFISPYLQNSKIKTMPKEFKEECRVNRLPKNIRAYIFHENILNKVLKENL